MHGPKPPGTEKDPALAPGTLPRQASCLERWWKFFLYLLFLLASEVLCGEYLGPMLEGLRRRGILGFGVHMLFLLTLLLLCASLLRLPGLTRRRRVCFTLLLAGSYSAFFMAIGDPLEQVRLLLFFPLGILAYRAKSLKWGGARYWLDLLLLFATCFFLDSVLKGVLPGRAFSLSGREAFPFLLMPLTGLVYARLRHPPLPGARWALGRDGRQYEGKAPIIDLHLYPRDIGYLLFLCVLMVVTNFITGHLNKESLIGSFRIDGDPGRTVVINGHGKVLCRSGEALKNVGGYYVTGNLLDGFLLHIYPDQSRPAEVCDFLSDFVNRGLRFRTASGSVYFDQKTSDWKWALWTLLEKEARGEGGSVWRRVNREDSEGTSGG